MKIYSNIASVVRNHTLPLALGLTTAITLVSSLPAQAQLVLYQETGGTESLRFDSAGLAVLNSIGLSLASVQSTDTPKPGYTDAFKIIGPPSAPGQRGTTWTFLYDGTTGEYIPLHGTTELIGSFFFNVDQTKLPSLPSVLEVGNLSASFVFDPTAFPPIIISLTDTANTGLKVFHTVEPGLPVVDLPNRTWSLEPLGIIFTKEFSDYLIAAGATQSVEGLKIAEARGDRTFAEVVIPEPSSVFGLLGIGALGLFVRRKKEV